MDEKEIWERVLQRANDSIDVCKENELVQTAIRELAKAKLKRLK